MQKTPVWFLGPEDLLEKGQATHSSILGLPLWLSWQRICLQWGRPGFDPGVGKISWRRERLPTPVFWPGEFYIPVYGLDYTVHGVAKSQTQLSNFHFTSLPIYYSIKRGRIPRNKSIKEVRDLYIEN